MHYMASLVASAALAVLASSADIASSSWSTEFPAIRSYSYVGGRYADNGAGGHVFVDQMYVERLQPTGGIQHSTPIIFIHGQAQTGTNFLNKPDGGRGWASRFVEQGYEVFIIDQTLRGRSAWFPGNGASTPSTYSAEIIQQRFTAPQLYNLWPQAHLHTQWPGSGVMGDAIFDAFYSSNVQFISNATYQQTTVQNAGAKLLDKIGRPAIVVGHSQGGIMPLLLADARPSLVAGLVLLEPTGPPFRDAVFSTGRARPWGLTDIPVKYSPAVQDPSVDLTIATVPPRDANSVECLLQAKNPPPRKLANLANKPMLFITSEASYHAPYDYCSVEFLRQAGCHKLKFVELGRERIHGNGHMFFMEKNSDNIQAIVRSWIEDI